MMGLLEMWRQSKEIIHGRVGIVGWRRRVEVITTGQLHSTKSEPMYCAGSNLLAAYRRFIMAIFVQAANKV